MVTSAIEFMDGKDTTVAADDATAGNGGAREATAEEIAAARQEIKNNALERAERHFAEIKDTQIDFARRMNKIAESGGEMTEKEFGRWEAEVADQIKWAYDEVHRGGMNLDQTAEAAARMVAYQDNPHIYGTIESKAGMFYRERNDVLYQAVENGNRPSKEQDLELIYGFTPAVMRHLQYRYMTPTEVADYGYKEYDAERTAAHNDLIRHLNALNNLARKYGVQPLTPRNFWTSDIRAKEDQTPAMRSVMSYDRASVEGYATNAFKDAAELYEKRRDRLAQKGR